jgi:hypothetical protein
VLIVAKGKVDGVDPSLGGFPIELVFERLHLKAMRREEESQDDEGSEKKARKRIDQRHGSARTVSRRLDEGERDHTSLLSGPDEDERIC